VLSTLTSDNQTSFQKADNEITEWYKTVNWDAVQEATCLGFRQNSGGIEWHFNPPNAFHFGGIFDIIVKALKRTMKIVISRADLDEEAFWTCVSKVMFMLKNWPIQPTGSIHDQEPLTPNLFIHSDLANSVFRQIFLKTISTTLTDDSITRLKFKTLSGNNSFLKLFHFLDLRQKSLNSNKISMPMMLSLNYMKST
jgi:hypothetical protein